MGRIWRGNQRILARLINAKRIIAPEKLLGPMEAALTIITTMIAMGITMKLANVKIA